MTDAVLGTMTKYGMNYLGRDVMVCVSGGADSMALLHFMASQSERLGCRSLFACHFNHGLRGAESDGEEEMVRRYCAGRGIRLVCGAGYMNERPRPVGMSVEMYARELRHAFFAEAAGGEGTAILTAHNLNDRVETLLFNLARGGGLRGARGIEPVRGRLYRPLIETSRDQIELYCRVNSIPYAIDSSNLTDDYSRNRIRHRVLPELLSVNAGALNNMARFCDLAADADRYLEGLAARLLEGAKCGRGVLAAPLAEAEEPIRSLALKLLLEGEGCQVDARRLELAGEVAAGLLTAFEVDGFHRLALRGDLLMLEGPDKPTERTDYRQPAVEGENPLPCGRTAILERVEFKVSSVDTECLQIVCNMCVDCDKIKGNIFFASRSGGERFSSRRRGCTKSLKKLLCELGVPASERRLYPVLCDDEGIIWVAGQGCDRRVAPDQETKNVIKITFKGE